MSPIYLIPNLTSNPGMYPESVSGNKRHTLQGREQLMGNAEAADWATVSADKMSWLLFHPREVWKFSWRGMKDCCDGGITASMQSLHLFVYCFCPAPLPSLG